MIFIDTGALLARHLARDHHHETALEGWAALAARQRKCMTSNFVLDETVTLLGRRAGHDFSAQRAEAWWSSGALQIVRPEQQDELAALELYAKYADQRVSFTDCISFALMKRHRVRTAFTFDRHFALPGFRIWPG